MPWGLAAAGVGLIGSLFGGGKKTETTSSVDYVKMVREAEKAGFNPLTALRNGGAAGFSSQVTSHPALSAGDAFGAVGNFLAAADPKLREREDLTNRLMQAQIKAMENTPGQKSMDVPVALGASAVHSRGGWSGTQPGPLNPAAVVGHIGMPPVAQQGENLVTNPLGFGEVNPNSPDGEHWATRWDEVGGFVGGLATFMSDMNHWGRMANRHLFGNGKQVKNMLPKWMRGDWYGNPVRSHKTGGGIGQPPITGGGF